jgi:hypothetical protein
MLNNQLFALPPTRSSIPLVPQLHEAAKSILKPQSINPPSERSARFHQLANFVNFNFETLVSFLVVICTFFQPSVMFFRLCPCRLSGPHYLFPIFLHVVLLFISFGLRMLTWSPVLLRCVKLMPAECSSQQSTNRQRQLTTLEIQLRPPTPQLPVNVTNYRVLCKLVSGHSSLARVALPPVYALSAVDRLRRAVGSADSTFLDSTHLSPAFIPQQSLPRVEYAQVISRVSFGNAPRKGGTFSLNAPGHSMDILFTAAVLVECMILALRSWQVYYCSFARCAL